MNDCTYQLHIGREDLLANGCQSTHLHCDETLEGYTHYSFFREDGVLRVNTSDFIPIVFQNKFWEECTIVDEPSLEYIEFIAKRLVGWLAYTHLYVYNTNAISSVPLCMVRKLQISWLCDPDFLFHTEGFW